jgi:hypothetical protein
VTTKARKYIFILHSTGMANIRVADLAPDLKKQLGYDDLEKKEEAKTAAATAWARQAFGAFKTTKVMALENKLQKGWRDRSPDELKALMPTDKSVILMTCGSVAVIYLFFCYCWMLICKKTGNDPGLLIWLPLLQSFPILRAARMSPLWFLAFMVPLLNLFAFVVLSFRLAKARGKTAMAGFFLAFPPTSFPAFLYLAFSSGVAVEKTRSRGPQIMTLETA